MFRSTRRELLGGFSRGILAIGIGARFPGALAFADDETAEGLSFGALEPLVARMQESEPDALLRSLVRDLRTGTELHELVAAAALANARSFGGTDYEGYHAAMALAPAYAMSGRIAGVSAAVPVLKVIHRNTARIRTVGGRDAEALRSPIELEGEAAGGAREIRGAVRERELERAERALASSCRSGAARAFDDLQATIADDFDVHRVVLAWRMWETLPLCGQEHAETLFRQCVRFCVQVEEGRVSRGQPEPALRALLGALLDEHELGARPLGSRRASDEELDQWAQVYFAREREEAARHAAERLAAGYDPEDVGRALALASSELVLRDRGRTAEGSYGRAKGSVHGASVGVHASDSARAWREIARVVGPRAAAASLVAGAYDTAGQARQVGAERFPYAERGAECDGLDATQCLARLRGALAESDQALACAAIEAHAARGGDAGAAIDACFEVALAADGALHAEKYFRTATQDLENARATHALPHLLALARVSASESGVIAPGVAEARALLAG